MATKVSLRQKKISKGRMSLYLDFHPPIPHPKPFLNKKTGEMVTTTRREFLGLYIFEKPKSPMDKQHNNDTLKIGESIRQKRANILNKPEIYNEFEKEQLRIKELGEQCFVEFYKRIANKRIGSNHANWNAAYNFLQKFTKGTIKFVDINLNFLEDFKEFLLTTTSNRSVKTTLSQNSASSYFNKIRAALKQAFKEGYLQIDLASKIDPIKTIETRRNVLTIEELNKLVKTPCKEPLLKRVALFSALTGLRHIDMKKMKWRELELIGGQGYRINFDQKKTKGVEYYDISEQAYSFTEGTKNPRHMPKDENVFKGLKYSAHKNEIVSKWIEAAGITKKISYHNFRHSFATLQLSKGTNIVTISKMLGHKNLKTTMIYTKIYDEQKREAANKIKLDL